MLSVSISMLFHDAKETKAESDKNETLKKKALIAEVEKIIDENFLKTYTEIKSGLNNL